MKKRRGKSHGAAMMVWMFFATLFDPKKAAATEQIETQKRTGNIANRPIAGAPPEP